MGGAERAWLAEVQGATLKRVARAATGRRVPDACEEQPRGDMSGRARARGEGYFASFGGVVKVEVEVEVMPNSSSSSQPLGLGEPVHPPTAAAPATQLYSEQTVYQFCILSVGSPSCLGVSHSVFFYRYHILLINALASATNAPVATGAGGRCTNVSALS